MLRFLPLACCGMLAANAYGQFDYATPYTFTTVAGSPILGGSADGTGLDAQFDYPRDVAVDAAGNVYVADSANDEVRKITPAGVVTTLAGSASQSGSTDGTGSAALFDGPSSLAVDNQGNVYVSDTLNDTIRKITPTGAVTTLAGSAGHSGSADGMGSAAEFSHPEGVAVDSAGNVYVADNFNQTIREVTPAGAVTTLAGSVGQMGSSNGTGTAARFLDPYGIVVDKAGNVYVSDAGEMIRKITPASSNGVTTWVVTTLAGSPGIVGIADGTGSLAQFDGVTGLSVDGDGNIYAADSSSETIRVVTQQGVVTTLAGFPGQSGHGDGVGSAAKFNDPTGVAVDSGGNLYVADLDNESIRKITPSATNGGTAWTVSTFAGLDRNGDGDGIGEAAWFNGPAGVAVDRGGNVYVADSEDQTIRRIAPTGEVTTLAGSLGVWGNADGVGSAAQFLDPGGVAVDGAGNIYVADTGNNLIRLVTPATTHGTTSWAVSTIAGGQQLGFNGGYADGTGSAAKFYEPTGIAVDGAGSLYVADYGNSTIRKITPTQVNGGTAWVVTTLAGNPGPGYSGFADGTGSAAKFRNPTSVAVDQQGNVFVADTENNRIRKITPSGVVATLAGDGEYASVDGTVGVTEVGYPVGIAVDNGGNVYVTCSCILTESGAVVEFYTVRELSEDGVMTTLAGSGPPGSADGTGSSVSFQYLSGLAVDVSGNLFVADSGNDTIRKGAPATAAITVEMEPQSQTINAGGTVEFSVAAKSALAGPAATTYQWQFNGVNLSDGNGVTGSATPQLLLQGAGSANAGNYDCVVSAEGASTQSYSAALTVVSTTTPGSVASLSGRAFVGTGDDILIGGFYIVGNTSVTVLVQAIGPALAAAPYNVSGTLQKPALAIHQAQNGKDVILCSNTGWGSSPVLLAAAAAVYAQPVLQPNAADSEVVLTLPPGGYTAEVTGADGGTGVALCGIYQLP